MQFSDKEVAQILLEVSVTKSEAYVKLNETDFYEKRMVNLKKKWIQEGLDPEEEERKFLNKRKTELKKKQKDLKRLQNRSNKVLKKLT